MITALGTPFGTPWLAVLDTIRIIVGAAGFVLAGYQVRLVIQAVTPGQKARFAAVGLAMAILSGSRLQNLGVPVSWQLIGAIVAVALLAYGSWAFRREAPGRLADPYTSTRHRRADGAS